MQGIDCLILSYDDKNKAHKAIGDFAHGAVQQVAKIGTVSLDELTTWESVKDSEMGVLFVPVTTDDDLTTIRQTINQLRNNKCRLMVAALTNEGKLAESFQLQSHFDLLIDTRWASASDQLTVFLHCAASSMQNRAFKAFLNNAVDGYWIWHILRDEIEWSDRTADMTNLSSDQVPRNIASFTNLIHEDDKESVGAAIQDHLENNVPYQNVRMRVRTGEGTYGHFVANGQAIRDAQGQPLILVGSLTDITAIKDVEQKLDDTQKRFSVLFNYMNDAAVLADVETGLILEANKPAERLWGKPVSELVGTHQSQLHPPTLSAEAIQVFQDHIAALQKHKHDSVHVPVLAAGGVEIPAEISSSLIELEGKMTILGVFRDISERVKAERELRERDAQIQLSSHLASMGTLAAGVAHEINNPLTYVLGNLDIIKEYLMDNAVQDAAITQTVDAALTGGRYVREIVADLKAISRMDSSDNTCDASEVIRIATRIAMSDLRHKGQIELHLVEVPNVAIASARLSQVILNLLSNAARAFTSNVREQNIIHVTSSTNNGFVQIEISDNGVGISKEDLDNIWKPFFTKQHSNGGTGLGLPISRRILEEVGASLTITSEVNQGTNVIIQLPMDASNQAQTGTEQSNNTPSSVNKKPNLLIVDDDVLVTTVVEHMLRKDFQLTIYNDARSAIEILKAGVEFDLVICDIMMPEMDGRAFYEQAKDIVPILYITGGAVTEENIQFEKNMLNKGRLIHKPFQKTEISSKIMQVLKEESFDFDGQHNDDSNDEALAKLHKHLADVREFLGAETLQTQLIKMSERLTDFQALGANGISPGCAESARKLSSSAKLLGLHELSEQLQKLQNAAETEEVQTFANLIANLSEPCALVKRYVNSLT